MPGENISLQENLEAIRRYLRPLLGERQMSNADAVKCRHRCQKGVSFIYSGQAAYENERLLRRAYFAHL